jgi:hypothetical protein
MRWSINDAQLKEQGSIHFPLRETNKEKRFQKQYIVDVNIGINGKVL